MGELTWRRSSALTQLKKLINCRIELRLECSSCNQMTGNSKRIVVRIVSTAQTGYFYTMTRNRLKSKLELMKHDPVVNKHVLFVEQKVRKGEQKSKAEKNK